MLDLSHGRQGRIMQTDNATTKCQTEQNFPHQYCNLLEKNY